MLLNFDGSNLAVISRGQKMGQLVTTHIGVIYPWHHDQMGHMNVQHYVGKFDEGTWNFFAELGLGRAYLAENKVGMAAVQQNVTYRRELIAGDRIEVRSGVLEIKSKTVRFVHEMRNRDTGEIAAYAEITGVFLDLETRRSHPFPGEFRVRAAKFMVDYEFEGPPAASKVAA